MANRRGRGIRTAVLLAALTLGGALGGCRAGGAGGAAEGRLESVALRDDPRVLPAEFTEVVYRHDPAGDTTFYLSDVPLETLLSGTVENAQILHIELLWRPRAGQTPMDSAATNASIRHIILSRGEVGVYGGAGFALPGGAPGDEPLAITLRDGTVRLLDSSAGFVDLLSPARLTGSFRADLDPDRVRGLQYAVSQIVTNALGRSRFVSAPASSAIEPVRITHADPAGAVPTGS